MEPTNVVLVRALVISCVFIGNLCLAQDTTTLYGWYTYYERSSSHMEPHDSTFHPNLIQKTLKYVNNELVYEHTKPYYKSTCNKLNIFRGNVTEHSTWKNSYDSTFTHVVDDTTINMLYTISVFSDTSIIYSYTLDSANRVVSEICVKGCYYDSYHAYNSWGEIDSTVNIRIETGDTTMIWYEYDNQGRILYWQDEFSPGNQFFHGVVFEYNDEENTETQFWGGNPDDGEIIKYWYDSNGLPLREEWWIKWETGHEYRVLEYSENGLKK